MDGKTKFWIVVGLCIIAVCFYRGCSKQAMTRSWGDSMNVPLEPNQKLIEVTWKGDNLWFLTKEMTDDDVAESYQFYERDTTRWFEGCVYIDEIKLSPEEYEEYQTQKTYEHDYYFYSNSNYDENGQPIFIQYDIETNRYILLKPYKYGEAGELLPAY